MRDRGPRGMLRRQSPRRGVATFTGGSSADVAFATAFPDTNYVVTLTPSTDSGDDSIPGVAEKYASKTERGFTIVTEAPFTGRVNWTAEVCANE